MAYTPDYDQGDVAPSVFDMIVTGGILLTQFISLIILVLLARWAMKATGMRKR